MAPTWSEIDVAQEENRHELVLSGAEVSHKIEKHGLDEDLYSLKSLNFLEISRTCLAVLSPELCNLANLTNLVLHGNKFETLPSEIGKLSKLKFLDISRNQIKSLPEEISQLDALQTLNVSGNLLSDFPDVSSLVQLHILELSHNTLESLPDGITNPNLTVLAQILANGNKLQELPTDLSEIVSLKTLDVSDNCLSVIPPEISECQKLKEFRYGGNKLKDRRLAKMMDQCSTKAVLDHLHVILDKERKAGGGKSKDKKRKKKGKAKDEVEELAKNLMKVLHFDDAKGLTVTVSENILGVRQYLVGCVVKHLNFNKTKNIFKRFLNLQTRLHDTSCKKRQLATIATHDLKLVQLPLSYEARPPSDMKLTPLGKLKETTAGKLMERLLKEADDFRKEKKRSTLSGIHQYLDLLDGHTCYPCMMDSKGAIISFPPITNCDATKVSRETHDILIEVTSSTNLDACKKIMDELLQGLLEMGLGSEEPPEPSGESGAVGGDTGLAEAFSGENGGWLKSDQVLVLEQVKVVDHTGALKVVYPSRVDLQNEAYRLERE